MSTAFLTRFALILFIKNISGQQNALVYNENCECNGLEAMQQPIHTYAIVKTIQDLMNQKENTAALVEKQGIRLPPDIQQQPLQVQQNLQVGKPLQLQAPPLQQPLQVQPPMQLQQLTQSHPSFDTIQPLIPLQKQDIPQLQPLQKQPQLQSDQSWQSYQPVQPLQSLELQQLQQSKQVQTPQLLQQTVQSLDSLQPLKAMQQPLGFRQFYPQTPSTSLDLKNGAFIKDTPFNQNINNNQRNSQINIKWQSSNPLGAINVENPCNTQNANFQPRQNSINSPIEVIATAQKSKDKLQGTPFLPGYILSQPPASLSVASAAPTPVVSNCHSVATKPSIKPAEIPLTASYNYMIPTPPNQMTITQLPYNNPTTDLQNIKYNNQNSGFPYEQSTLPVALQSRPFVQSQSSMLPGIPLSIPQAPTIPSQYVVSSGYPIGTVMARSNTRNKSVSSSLKSILPIIFQLLKEKIATCNDCPCECKNVKSDNKPDVACGYSSQKNYGHFAKDALPVLDTVSEEEQGPKCLREPKNCEEIKNASLETSGEISEEEGSDEEEIDEDEEN